MQQFPQEQVSMEVEVIEGRPPVVRAWGEIDLSNVTKLSSALDSAVPGSAAGIIIDMTDVTYIDSAGVQVVIWAYQQIRREGTGLLAVVLAQNDVRTIFNLIHTELLPGFAVVDSVDEARQKFSPD
jgi:anti-anti-sigma factor